ncbi:internal virion protein [Aeromonas phage AerS_266]|nr:internal virion protein [Aeromonas phage AerS_266]
MYDTIFAAVAGTESADLDTQVEVTAEAVAEAIVEKELAEVEVELAEQEKDIEKNDTAIEVLTEKVEELEEEISGMEGMLNGTTEFNSALFHDKMKRAAKIAARFGATVEIQGAESFADASTASMNAVAGIESFKERAGKAKEAIKKFFVDLYNGFIAFFMGIFNKFKGLEKQAKNLGTSVVKDPKEKVNLSASASWLPANGKVSPAGDVSKVIGAVETALKAGGKEGALSGVQSAVNALKAVGTASSIASNEATETFKVTVGGGSFTVVYPKTVAGLGKVAVSGLTGGEAKKDQAPMEQGALRSIANDVVGSAKALQFSKLDSKSLTAQRDNTIASLERMAAEDKTDVKEDIDAIKAACRAGLKLQKGALSVAADLLQAQLALVKAHY